MAYVKTYKSNGTVVLIKDTKNINYNQSNYNQSNYNQYIYNQPNYDQYIYNQSNYDQYNFNQLNYNQPNYNYNHNQLNYIDNNLNHNYQYNIQNSGSTDVNKNNKNNYKDILIANGINNKLYDNKRYVPKKNNNNLSNNENNTQNKTKKQQNENNNKKTKILFEFPFNYKETFIFETIKDYLMFNTDINNYCLKNRHCIIKILNNIIYIVFKLSNFGSKTTEYVTLYFMDCDANMFILYDGYLYIFQLLICNENDKLTKNLKKFINLSLSYKNLENNDFLK
jgi:hypothetical protein